MEKIPIGSNFALVDNEDFESLVQYTWRLNSKGYAMRNESRVGKPDRRRGTILMHRVILGGKEIDHRDSNKLNNQKSNLRVCTHAENNRNKSMSKNNKSGYKGVYFHKDGRRNPYQVLVAGQYVGVYSLLKDAASAYNKVALELFGRYAKINKIQGE